MLTAIIHTDPEIRKDAAAAELSKKGCAAQWQKPETLQFFCNDEVFTCSPSRPE
ncbi:MULTISPECIES: hypothetical protein [Pseudomonas]|uniref:hypothetical protein n=1 Tax=Pseudomonas TaxID=286 RepID=UPI001E35906F|nr:MULTISPECIES: hypothetical protein [Pseudomonas]MCD5984368.1 hypothetical protein [Pseudomonas sp. CDFA 610]MCQ9470917.1 hypothetical protein [Pseudomonas alliivorans]